MSPHDHAAQTDAGKVRDHNEDSVLAEPPLFAVADGVGGANAGEVASGAAIAAIRSCHDDIVSLVAAAAGAEQLIARLVTAVEQAHETVRELQLEDSQREGMATTLSAFVLAGSRIVGAHVGDSRVYLVGRDGIVQITRDHSLVGELVRSGSISAAEARTHPQANVILQAIGSEPDISIETFAREVPAGAWVLACSDGLSSPLTDAEIHRIVTANNSATAAASALVEAANDAGGPDNISVVLVQPQDGDALLGSLVPVEDRVLDAPGATPETAARPAHVAAPNPAPALPRSRPWKLALLLAVAAVAAAGAAFAWTQSYFLGEFDDGSVGVFRGFPIDSFSREYRSSDLEAEDLSSFDRAEYLDNPKLRSRGNALELLAQLEEAHAERPGLREPQERSQTSTAEQ